MTTKRTIKSALEAMMFVWGEPLDPKTVATAMHIEKSEAIECFKALQEEYDTQQRGIRIREINGSFQFVTDACNYDYIKAICTPVKERRLSLAALEVLAIVAYKQPVTKSEIDSIRGIKSDRVLEGLMRKGLIEERGRSSAIGRPILYGTTDVFLASFDLKDLKNLPAMEDIEDTIQYETNETGVAIQQTSLDLAQ